MKLKNEQEVAICPMCMRKMDVTEDKIKELEDDIVIWKLKYIGVCDRRDILEEENSILNESMSECDKAVNALQNQVEQLEAENEKLQNEIKGFLGQHDSSDQ